MKLSQLNGVIGIISEHSHKKGRYLHKKGQHRVGEGGAEGRGLGYYRCCFAALVQASPAKKKTSIMSQLAPFRPSFPHPVLTFFIKVPSECSLTMLLTPFSWLSSPPQPPLRPPPSSLSQKT